MISAAQYGSDEKGWRPELAVQVNRDNIFHCFFLDAEDFDNLPETALKIAEEMAKVTPTHAQLSSAAGNFLA